MLLVLPVWLCGVQERQDALYEITDDPSINLMVVVGGFNSSNTSHLQEIAEHKGIPSFWVDSAARIDVEGNKVRRTQHNTAAAAWLTPGSLGQSGGGGQRWQWVLARIAHVQHHLLDVTTAVISCKHAAHPVLHALRALLVACRCCTRLAGVS